MNGRALTAYNMLVTNYLVELAGRAAKAQANPAYTILMTNTIAPEELAKRRSSGKALEAMARRAWQGIHS